MTRVCLHPRIREYANRSLMRRSFRLDEERARALSLLQEATQRARGLQAYLGANKLLDPLIAELEVTCQALEALDIERPPTKFEMDSMVKRTQCIADSFEAMARLLSIIGPGQEAAGR